MPGLICQYIQKLEELAPHAPNPVAGQALLSAASSLRAAKGAVNLGVKAAAASGTDAPTPDTMIWDCN